MKPMINLPAWGIQEAVMKRMNNPHDLLSRVKELLVKSGEEVLQPILSKEETRENLDKTLEELAKELLDGGEDGRELDPRDEPSQETWLSRLEFQLVWLTAEDYARALIQSLWLAPRFAATDFGSSRRRDLAQVWTDAARGRLGEIAVGKFFSTRLQTELKLSHRVGSLEEFLPSDVEEIRTPGEGWRNPRLKISIKTTKFSGRWLDLPGAQFNHSDVFVLVKLGILRQHFVAFLKHISFVRDKLMAHATKLGALTEKEAEDLWRLLPDFIPIPAYISGFLEKADIPSPEVPRQIEARIRGRRGRSGLKIVISAGVGIFTTPSLWDAPEMQKLRKKLHGEGLTIEQINSLPIQIEPIIEVLSGSERHFLAHSGALKFGPDEWKRLVEKL